MRFPETIQTERLLLRRWRGSDAERLFQIASDPRIGPRCGWLPHTDAAYSLNVIQTILSADGTYAVTIPETDTAIGSISLQPTHNPTCIGHLELGYWLAAEYWGNGLIPEAAEALIRCGFENLGLTELWCSHFAENHNSRRVIKKLGFHYRFRGKECWDTLNETKEVWYYSKTP